MHDVTVRPGAGRPARPADRGWVARLALLLACLLPACGLLADTAGPQPPLPTVELVIGDQVLTAELARTRQQRYMGLSYRRSLDEDAGMLFVYPDEQWLTFTMRNTLLPLSIAFISEDLVINEIHDMDVGPGQLFPSQQRAMYALEVNQGWFERQGVDAGTRITMPSLDSRSHRSTQ